MTKELVSRALFGAVVHKRTPRKASAAGISAGCGMKQLKRQFPVSLMSRVFEVCKSGYYAWLKRGASKRTQDNTRLEVAIKATHLRTRESYGPERL